MKNKKSTGIFCVKAYFKLCFVTAGFFIFTDNASAQVYCNGNMYIASGASMNLTDSYTGSSSSSLINNGDLFVAGNFISDEPAMQSGLGTIYFAGTGLQTVGGYYPQFHNVVMNNNAGISLTSDVFILANLNFIQGIISTGNYKITHANRGSVTNAGQSTGWINGRQEKYFIQGLSNTRNFEIGDDTYYTPSVLGLANINVNGTVIAQTVNTEHPNITSSEVNALKSVNRYWTFTSAGVAFDNASAALSWVSADEDAGSSPSNYKAALYSSGTWAYPSSSVSSNTITISNITRLGSFAAGEYTCAGIAPAKPGGITSGQQFNLCGGGTFTYTIAPVSGATHYTWTVPSSIGVVEDNGTSITLNIPYDIGRQQLLVTADNACGSSISKTINLFAKPSKPVIAGPACVRPYQTGLMYNITNAEPNVIYNWKVPGIARITAGQGTPTVTVDWRGNPGIILAVPQNACDYGTKNSYTVSVSNNCNAVAKTTELQKNILVYPNPASSSCAVVFTAEKTERCSVYITDISGKQLLNKEINTTAGSNKVMIDLKNYPGGVYLISIALSEGVQSIKVIKQ